MEAIKEYKTLINRHVGIGDYKISDIFPTLYQNPIMLEIFYDQDEVDAVFENTAIRVIERRTYMFVGNDDGSISIGIAHLETSENTVLYLDIIHELVHVKQHRKGLDLYDLSNPYVDRPTEIEAYVLTVKEARRIGLTDKQIFDYLTVEWVTPEEHRRLAKRLNVSIMNAQGL